MAKNKIAIDVKVDDKGTTKKVGVQAKKAAKGLDDVGASAHTANRNMKGVSQQSSSGTKNFSKMAQGMGGIVGVYATLAAQAFALSAAFEFLKKVGDLRVLKDSQVAYASTTGIAITSLSRDIRLAADGMLNFEEASKSAAIGLSSGLNAGQLTKLAEGASAVSKVLGRDVSDSYDRLVRGVTKAEPELLDELGITLRLEDAKNKYAIAIGKTVKELTLLEAKQAVAVEVQSQLDKKFISTTSAIEIQGNAMAKFGVAFNNVFVKFAGFIEGPVDAAANFFANNIKSLIAVIGLFALSIIKTMLPSLDSFRARAVESAEQASVAFNKAKASYDAMKASTSGGVITGALQDVDAKAGSGIDRLKQGKEINKRQAAALLKYAKMEKGVYLRLTKYQKTVYIKALKDILGQKETFWQKTKRGWYGLGTVIDRTAKKSVVVWRSAMVMMTKATTRAASAMNTAMKAAGFIGLFLMVLDIAKSIGKATGLIKKPAKALTEYINQVEATREKMKSLGTEYGKLNLAVSTHLEAVKKLNQSENLQPTITSYKTLGNAISTTLNEMADLNEQLLEAENMKKAITIGNAGSIGTPEFVTALEESQLSAKGLAAELVKISQNKAFAGLWDSLGMSIQNVVQQFSDSTVAGRISADTLRDVAAELLNLSNVAATFEESYNSSNLAFDKFVQGISQYKTSVTDMLNTTGKEIDMAVDQVGKLGQAMLLTDESPKQLENLKTRLAFLNLINAKETEAKNSQLSADRMLALQAHGVTKLVEQRLNREKKVTDLKIKQREILIDLASLEQGAITMSEEKKGILQQQEAQLREQISLTEKANSAIYRTGMAFWQGFEDGAVTNLASLIKGEKTSFKKAVLGTLLEGLGATADQIASDLVERFMSILPIFGKKAKTPAEIMKESILAGAEEAKLIWAKAFGDAGDVIAKKIKDAAKAPVIPASTKNIATGDIDTKGQVFDSRLAEAAAQGAKEAVALKAAQLAAANKYNNQVNDGSNPNQPLYVRLSSEARMDQRTGEKSIGAGMEIRKGSDLDEEALHRALKVVAPLVPGKAVLEVLKKAGLIIKADKVTVQDNTLGTGKIEEDGSTTWKGVMGPTKKNAQDADKGVRNNSEEVSTNSGALGKATGVIDNAMGTNGTFVTEMKVGFNNSLTHLASIIGSGGSTSGRGILSTLLQTTVSAVMGSYFPPTARTGGIISKGKKVPGYATGGIAKGSTSGYPATLHGTEAVVPLGTGRAIPVDMKGSGGSTNNIVVNISTEGQSSTQGSTGPDMEKMGGAIARAVQEELQNQKRSGGILNPYGVA